MASMEDAGHMGLIELLEGINENSMELTGNGKAVEVGSFPGAEQTGHVPHSRNGCELDLSMRKPSIEHLLLVRKVEWERWKGRSRERENWRKGRRGREDRFEAGSR